MVNFAEAAQNFDPKTALVIPKGEYDVRVDDAESVVAKSSGRSMIKAKFVVDNGPQEGRQLYNNFVWVPENDNAIRMFFTRMAYFGLDRDYFLKNPSLDQVAHDMIGKKVRVKVDHREWEEELQPDIKKIKAYLGVAGQMPGPGVGAAQPQPTAQPTTPQPTSSSAVPDVPPPAQQPPPQPAAAASVQPAEAVPSEPVRPPEPTGIPQPTAQPAAQPAGQDGGPAAASQVPQQSQPVTVPASDPTDAEPPIDPPF
jgi:hypothetical protein